jgi:hypothetical protein
MYVFFLDGSLTLSLFWQLTFSSSAGRAWDYNRISVISQGRWFDSSLKDSFSLYQHRKNHERGAAITPPEKGNTIGGFYHGYNEHFLRRIEFKPC